MIAEMPLPVPAVGGEYDATGPGLTGGLQQLMQQQQAAGGAGLPGGGIGQEESRFGASLSASGGLSGRSTGGLTMPGSMRSQGSGQVGGRAAARPGGGLQLGGQRAGQAGLQTGSPFGSTGGSGTSSFGLQRPGGTFGSLGGAFGQQGDEQEAAEPLLGPDGKPLKLVLLRSLPVDPFTGTADWGLRCYGEPPADRLWCGKDVFDVYSKSPAKAIDGTNYKDW
jgi:hypothetical protein